MNTLTQALDETPHETQDEPSREQPPGGNEQDTATP